MSDENDIMARIKTASMAVDNERAARVFVDENNNLQKISLELTNKIIESAVLNDPQIPVNLTPSALSILKSMVSTYGTKLLEYANGYQTTGRQFYFFLYDLVALAWYIDKLPPEFTKLQKMEGDQDNLMHNRIHAQLAYAYKTQGYAVGLQIKNSKGKKPDLDVDGKDIEIKTMVLPAQNSPESFERFSLTFRNSHTTATEQIDNGGIIVIAPWSQVMNNILKEYYKGLYSVKVPSLENNKTMLILEGNRAFEDFYFSMNSDQACEDIRQFAESGYRRVNPLAYLGQIRREGFPTSRSSDTGNMGNLGFTFKIG